MGKANELLKVELSSKLKTNELMDKGIVTIDFLIANVKLQGMFNATGFNEAVKEAVKPLLDKFGLVAGKPEPEPEETLTPFLVEGKIPQNTECQYQSRCRIFKQNECKHKGKRHNQGYSCAFARLYEFDVQVRLEKQKR